MLQLDLNPICFVSKANACTQCRFITVHLPNGGKQLLRVNPDGLLHFFGVRAVRVDIVEGRLRHRWRWGNSRPHVIVMKLFRRLRVAQQPRNEDCGKIKQYRKWFGTI